MQITQKDVEELIGTDKVVTGIAGEPDGSARPLPAYLHELSFDDTYPADAEWLYSQLGPGDLGRCSAVRRGGTLWRNYDWTFDDAAEFAVRVSGNASRLASVGMASVGSRLMESMVTSGKWSRLYKCLPGMTLDGINEKGVVAEINVDGGPKSGWHGTGANALHILAAVRWVLDHGETAAQAAAYLAANVKEPTGEMNFHFMVADATSTYVVENGAAHLLGADDDKVLTNFALFDEAHAGGGKERFALLAGGADIAAVNFTNAYRPGNDWDSDFASAAEHAAAIAEWAAQGTDREAHRGKTTSGGKAWWQTVHASEYDFTAKTMKVAVQESGDWHTFAVDAGSGGGADTVKHADFADLEEKQGMTLKEVGTMVNTLVQRLKGTVAALVAAFALGAFAEITPDTDFGDVDPFAKLGAVLESGGALPDDAGKLGTNANFRTAVAAVSPPVVLPTKWALANVTNSQGQAVGAGDVGAVSKTGGTMSGALDFTGAGSLNTAKVEAGKVTLSTDSGKIEISPTNYKTYDVRGQLQSTVSLSTTSGSQQIAVKSDIPTVYDWARQPNKPTYTAAEVGAVPTSRKINGQALTQDITIQGMPDKISASIVTNADSSAISAKLITSTTDNDGFGGTVKTEVIVGNKEDGSSVGQNGFAIRHTDEQNGSAVFRIDRPYNGLPEIMLDSNEQFGPQGNFIWMFPYASGTIALQNWYTLSTMLDDAATNSAARAAGRVQEKIVAMTAQATTNAVIAVRDRFYDEELDVTWKRTVSGGRIYYDIEAVGNSTED